jgi:pSer/pThr/pTyr-binding forkhead associated (FHA) protein
VITRDPETSRRHAAIDIHADGTVWLTDLGSTNGTFVDGVQIFGTIQLVDRQEFTCGKSTFMLLVRKEDSLHMD